MKDLYLRLTKLALALEKAGQNEMYDQVIDALDRIYWKLTPAELEDLEPELDRAVSEVRR